MSTYYPFDTLHSSLSSATSSDLSDIKYQVNVYPKPNTGNVEKVERTRRPTVGDLDIYMFPQTWSDTSLGFGGLAGQAFTSAYTVVIHCLDTQEYAVYHGGRFAYKINESCKGINYFLEDLKNHCVVGRLNANKYNVG